MTPAEQELAQWKIDRQKNAEQKVQEYARSNEWGYGTYAEMAPMLSEQIANWNNEYDNAFADKAARTNSPLFQQRLQQFKDAGFRNNATGTGPRDAANSDTLDRVIDNFFSNPDVDRNNATQKDVVFALDEAQRNAMATGDNDWIGNLVTTALAAGAGALMGPAGWAAIAAGAMGGAANGFKSGDGSFSSVLTGGLKGAGLAYAGGELGGMFGGSAGTTGDMAAVIQQANPALTAGEVMQAAQAYQAAGYTAAGLQSALSAGIPTGPIGNAPGIGEGSFQYTGSGSTPGASMFDSGYPSMTDSAVNTAAGYGGTGAAGQVVPGMFAPSMTDAAINAGIGAIGSGGIYGLGNSPVNLANSTGGAVQEQGLFGGLADKISSATGIPVSQLATLGSGALNTLGSYLQAGSSRDAAQTNADAQIRAAQIAADAAKFRPVGVTTRFGSSNFGYDANGNLNSAGYTVSPEMKAQQDSLMGMSNQALTQYGGAQAASAPLGQAAQSLFGLGQGYLGTSPQAQAAQYMQEQQALLAGTRASSYANMQNNLQQQGRAGLSVGGGGGMTAANPEMQAYYNALNQQNLQLAANATQGGMDYAKFGTGLMGAGGDLQNQMYSNQAAAFKPYQTALGGVTNIENLGQQSMMLGADLGNTATAAAAASGRLQAQGMTNAANTMQPINSYNPWAAPLGMAADVLSNYKWGQ